MKYATWKLNFDDPNYGTGPEVSIIEQGGTAEGGLSHGNVTKGAKILGYFTGEPTELQAWDFTEITQQEALDFVLAIDNTAFVNDHGRISVAFEDFENPA
jgi:hypothetical protein